MIILRIQGARGQGFEYDETHMMKPKGFKRRRGFKEFKNHYYMNLCKLWVFWVFWISNHLPP